MELFENANLHIYLWYSSVLISVCLFKVLFGEKIDLHIKQENGFSPVCIYPGTI